MKKEKVVAILLTTVVMAMGITACQKNEEGTTENIESAEAVAEAPAEMKTTSGNKQETEQQEEDLSFKSFADSPEMQACMEWWNYLDEYDPDDTIHMEVMEQEENEPKQTDEYYEEYFCYTDEMRDKVDEICAAYGLVKLSGCQYDVSYDEICGQAGTGNFCRDSETAKHDLLSGYLYDDGSFSFEGNLALTGSTTYEAGYQVCRAVKGTFNVSYLHLEDLSKYNVRRYITKGGDEVFFLCHEEINPSVIAEREKSFVVISGFGDLSDISDVNDESLELFADAFDFSAIP